MAKVSNDDSWQESDFGGFFKPKDHMRAAGLAVVGKRVEIYPGTVYNHKELRQDSARLVADVYVFRTETDAEDGVPTEVLENIVIQQTALMGPWAKVDFGPKKDAGVDNRGKPIEYRNALKVKVGGQVKKIPLGQFIRPTVLSQPDRAWEWDFDDISKKAAAGIVKFIESLPDPDGVIDEDAFAPRREPEGAPALAAAQAAPDFQQSAFSDPVEVAPF